MMYYRNLDAKYGAITKHIRMSLLRSKAEEKEICFIITNKKCFTRIQMFKVLVSHMEHCCMQACRNYRILVEVS